MTQVDDHTIDLPRADGAKEPRFRGLYPVAPTTFTATGGLDLDSQKRCVDFMIDAGSDGLCILANFSEQFLLSDEERETLARPCSNTSLAGCR